MINYKLLLVFAFSIFVSFSFSQNSFIVNGNVLEKSTSTAMEYCTVAIYNKKDSSLIDGTVTNKIGIFSLNVALKGSYYVVVSYIGFESKRLDNITLDLDNKTVNLKNINLDSDGEKIEGVNVVGEKSTIRYEMDKKVIDVGKDIASSNGSAIDVLENVSSVEVDIEGNVKLRGSDNFMVLINGKPSTLSGKEALQQTSASNIKNIELITNPSAKYEAGNTGGIINIILKEEKQIGTSGMVSFKVGTFSNRNAKVSVKHNIKKLSFNFSASMYQNNSPNFYKDSLYTSRNSVTNLTNSNNEKYWKFKGYSFNYGIDYKIKKGHNLKFNFVFGKWGMYVDKESEVFNENITINTELEYLNINDQDRYSKYFGPSLSYQAELKNKSSISTYVGIAQRDFSEKVLDSNFYTNNELFSKTKSTETGFKQSIRAKIDYALPIKEGKLELGAKGNSTWNNEATEEYDFDISQNIFRTSEYNDKNISYIQQVYGLYATYGNSFKKFKYSFGYRAEYIDRKISIKEDDLSYNYFKWDYFPSASLGYTINEDSKFYASYSKRIRRFHSYMLEPTEIKTGAETYFRGNPNLKPEIINSSEIGWSNNFNKKTTLSIEAFYKFTTDLNRWFNYVRPDGISTVSQPINIGEMKNIGIEASLNLKPLKWWALDITGSGFYTKVEGSFKDVELGYSNFNWKSRFSNNFTVSKNTKIQFTGRYTARRITKTNLLSPNLVFGLGLKQSFLKKSLNLTADIKNVFYTEKREWVKHYDGYYNEGKNKYVWPLINVGLSYKINNFRQSRSESESGQGDF